MGGNEEREGTIRALFPLVKKIAKRVRAVVPGAELDDLIGDGSIGLIRAVDQFNPRRGTTLEHYARRLIAGAMLNGLRRMDPVSERSRRAARDGEDHRCSLAVERGVMPTLAEMERLRPSFKRAVWAAHWGTPLSLDAPLPEAESPAFDHAQDPQDIALDRDRRAYLDALIDDLPQRQGELVRGYYFGERTLREVGMLMGVSSQRASQLHVAAVKRLRKAAYASPY